QRDEDFDFSYEGLLSLSNLLGDVKPRGTPADIVSSLPKGKYRDWATPGVTDERCPICLDDYTQEDACLRIGGCSHWFHEGCLQVRSFLPLPLLIRSHAHRSNGSRAHAPAPYAAGA
ncbi:hypothetical protein C2E23DRAFT_724188, partial [Lenzites betulinus]